ncbi:hypothetical protein [Paenibacillus sp. OSY-SE]|uniref:hypothetical protein n=1 Tax=Paenibacillus sp. OSY-SE TaxID=1196323 RepID=UPI00031B587C|nr:hypothetical protein [Paenibacillus sp. OSY-SE]
MGIGEKGTKFNAKHGEAASRAGTGSLWRFDADASVSGHTVDSPFGSAWNLTAAASERKPWAGAYPLEPGGDGFTVLAWVRAEPGSQAAVTADLVWDQAT